MEAEELAHDKLELVRAHYEAFARGDLDGLLDGLDSEIAITVHDEHGRPEGQTIRGIEGARGFFEGMGVEIADRAVKIEQLREDEDRVLARVWLSGTVRSTGDSGVIHAVHLFRFFEGAICEIQTYRPNWRGETAESS